MYIKYLWYIIRHKWFVFIECCKYGLVWRGIVHDMSKLRPSEFIPYAKYFYGEWDIYTKAYINDAFDKAWLLHQHRNPHHWQYWVLREDDGGTKTVPIPMKYIKEMVADWRGAGRAINGKESNVYEWYDKNKSKMVIWHHTRHRIENIL
jgi:hypothetical protein